MEQYISKSALVAKIERRIKELQDLFKEDEKKLDSFQKTAIHLCIDECKVVLNILDTIEVKEINSVWHNIDDIPNFNLNGISDLIIDSCYGHIYREAHYYTPERWNTHIGFNANRQFRWAYEKDLINFD